MLIPLGTRFSYYSFAENRRRCWLEAPKNLGERSTIELQRHERNEENLYLYGDLKLQKELMGPIFASFASAAWAIQLPYRVPRHNKTLRESCYDAQPRGE